MSEISYDTVHAIRMEPDIYAGDNCDEKKPRWIESVDKEGNVQAENVISFNCNNYPAGTRILVDVPVCPVCGMPAKIHSDNKKCTQCDFDWENWVDEQYS